MQEAGRGRGIGKGKEKNRKEEDRKAGIGMGRRRTCGKDGGKRKGKEPWGAVEEWRMMNEDGGAITGEDGGRSRGAGNRRKEVAESNEKG